jgi:hypothetical protein
MKTPQYKTITLAAGAFAQIGAAGKFITIISISGSTWELAIDGESLEQVRPGLTIQVMRGFTLLRIRNAGGVAGTMIFYVSDEPLGMVDAAIVAALSSIDADLDRLTPAGTLAIVNRTVVAQAGVGSTLILAANPARKWCLVTADLNNANYVFLGATAAVDEATGSFFDMMAGGSWREHYTGAVWACSTNGTEEVRAYEST